jgi:hypothetical protein
MLANGCAKTLSPQSKKRICADPPVPATRTFFTPSNNHPAQADYASVCRALFASVAGVDLLGDRLERLLEARGQDRRAHVGDPERQQLVAMVSKLALQPAVAVHRPRHRVGELVAAQALTE